MNSLNIKVEVKQLVGWKEAYIAALDTEGKTIPKDLKEPSDKWKKSLLLPEHSPIRVPIYKVKWTGIPYFVAMHLVRHHIGIVDPYEPFVSTQRTDRVGDDIPRDKKSQTDPVSLSLIFNCNSIISVSRKRICSCASPETTYAWNLAIKELEKIDPITASVAVRECIYRGFCPERKCCGYVNTSDYLIKLHQYRTKL